MKRKRLLGSKLMPGTDYAEDIDPSSSLLNLGDVMLVFACGLMVALITFFNVDITQSDVDRTSLSNLELMDGTLENAGTGDSIEEVGTYTEVGTVYRDEATGQLYVLSPDAQP